MAFTDEWWQNSRLARTIRRELPTVTVLAWTPLLWASSNQQPYWLAVDDAAAVVRYPDGEVRLVTTDHGSLVEMHPAYLDHKYEEYLVAVERMKETRLAWLPKREA